MTALRLSLRQFGENLDTSTTDIDDRTEILGDSTLRTLTTVLRTWTTALRGSWRQYSDNLANSTSDMDDSTERTLATVPGELDNNTSVIDDKK